MLTTTKKEITLIGKSVVGDKDVELYTARIDSENPDDMDITAYRKEKILYRDNLEECQADRNNFEKLAYAEQKKVKEAIAAE